MKKKIKTSILIPAYNDLPYIKKCVESVLIQDIEESEIIISDNFSTDGTWEYLKSLTSPKIRIFRNNENIGMVPNWNKLLDYCFGEYIKILFADDYLLPGCLKKQIEILDKHKDVVMVCGSKIVVDSNDKKILTKYFLKENKIIDGIEAIKMIISSGSNAIGEPGNVLFRKNVLKYTGKFKPSPKYVEDLEMWFNILLYGKLFIQSECVAAYRISSSSTSVHRSKEQFLNFIKLIDEWADKKEIKLNKLIKLKGKILATIYFVIKQLIYFYLRIRKKI